MTAALRIDPLHDAQLLELSGSRRAGADLAPGALVGSVDLGLLDPDAGIEQRELGFEMQFTAPGVELRVDTRRLKCHASRASITLLFGRPGLDGREADAEAIEGALACDLDPWRRVGERFALVRIDLAAGEVLLASDRFAAWPLAWSRSGARVGFADRADRVPVGGIRRIDPQALFDYVYFHVVPAPRTVFAEVQQLEPATALRMSQAEVRRQTTWHPQFTRTGADSRPIVERFRTALRDAVCAELDDASTVGCYLSGGTDSSTVAGMLARERGPAKSFSIGFNTPGYDELDYARIAARHFGTEHHEYIVTPDDLTAALPAVAAHYDQPFGNSSALPAYYCALMARHHGVDRLLAGDGGDELFGGNVRYARQNAFEAYARIPQALRRALVEPLLANDVAAALPLARKVASYVRQARLPMPARMETYNLLNRFGADCVFTPALLGQVDAGAPAALQALIYEGCNATTLIDRMLAYDWRFTLADNDLRKVTGSAQLAAVDVAFPLLADSIVDLSLELQAGDKVRGRTLRPFFKRALADFLPAQTIAKRKHGFGLPIGPWLLSATRLRALAYEALNALADRQVIRRALVDDLFSRRLEQHAGYYGEMVWVLTMLEYWLRAHAPAYAIR